MGQITKQLFFNAPLERVWKVWTEVEKTPEWVEGVQESRVTSSVPDGKGLSWNEKCLFGKKVIQMDHEFSEWEPMKRTVIRTGLPMGGMMERTAEFKRVGAGSPRPSKGEETSPRHQTEVHVTLEWDLGMVGAMIGEDKLHHMMEKSFDLTAEKWKAKAEG